CQLGSHRPGSWRGRPRNRALAAAFSRLLSFPICPPLPSRVSPAELFRPSVIKAVRKGLDASATMEIYTAGCVAQPSGSWSSGHDIALTQRRSPVRIRSSPLFLLVADAGPRDRTSSMCDRRGESRDKHGHQREAGERNQSEPPRLISKMHVI